MKKTLTALTASFLAFTGVAYGASDLEIEVELYDNYAVVEYEQGDDEQEFRVDSTDRNQILDEIADELNMNVSAFEDIVEWEEEDGREDDDEDEDEEENEIEVELYDTYAVVEYEIDGDEDEFRVNSTNRDDIVDEITDELNMSQRDVEAVIEWEEEDGREEEDDDDEDEDKDEDEDEDEDDRDEDDEDNQDSSTNLSDKEIRNLIDRLIALILAALGNR